MKKNKITIDEAIAIWSTKNRRMGCVAATRWFCSRVVGFKPLRLTRYTELGETYEHVVASNGIVVVDLAPHADKPNE